MPHQFDCLTVGPCPCEEVSLEHPINRRFRKSRSGIPSEGRGGLCLPVLVVSAGVRPGVPKDPDRLAEETADNGDMSTETLK